MVKLIFLYFLIAYKDLLVHVFILLLILTNDVSDKEFDSSRKEFIFSLN